MSLYLILINIFDIFLFVLAKMGTSLSHDNSCDGSFTMWAGLSRFPEDLQFFPEFTPFSLWSSERQEGGPAKINGFSYDVSNRSMQIPDLGIRKRVGLSQGMQTGPE